MDLHINTVAYDQMIIALLQGDKIKYRRVIKSDRNQAEKLLPAIDKLLSQNKIHPKDIKRIIVASSGSSFTALRIGVITANALAYAWKIPVIAAEKSRVKNKKFGAYSLVTPLYDREPNIGISKKPAL